MKKACAQRRCIAVLGIVVAGVLLLCCPGALALDPALDVSQYAHTAWKIRDGFAKGEIHSIAQTPDGYLWLGTEFGLLRFDGVRAVPWQPPGGEQLPSNLVGSLLLARDGTLWIGTLKGLASWKDGKLTRHPEVVGAMVDLFLEDREQTVWFGTWEASKARLCAIRDGKVECYASGTFGDFVNPLYEDHNGNLWVGSQTGLWRWAPGSPRRYAFSGGVKQVNAVAEDDSGVFLLGTNDGLKRLADGKIENYRLPGITGHFPPFWADSPFFRSRNGSLWIGTTQGLVHLHQGRVDRFSAADGLSGDFIYKIFEDREGDVWVITQDGLDRFREYTIPTISRKQGLSNSAVWSVQATLDGSIWIGTGDGLNRWASGQMTVYRGRGALGQSRRGDESKLNVSGTATEIANSGLVGNVGSLGLDDAGRLWASTSDGMFYFERGRFVRVPGVPGGTPGYEGIFSIAGDGHGNTWVLHGTAGVFHWSPTAAIQQVPWTEFAQKMARSMLPGREPGGLWLGFWEDGVVYLKDGKVVHSYGTADGLGEGRVTHLRSGPNGGLWASTEGGLSRMKDGHTATLTSKNGLPCDEVHWSMEDDDHAVWLYMPCGLVRIARSELDAWINDAKHGVKTMVFDNSDGVRSVGAYGFMGPQVTKSPDGRIWFVPRDGVSVLDPARLPFNKLPPPVHIEQITADRKTYDVALNGIGDGNGQMRLPALIRDLEIDYAALSMVAPEKVRFRYKLEGRDSDWQEAGNRRQAFYTDLPPRNYRFRVTACNNSGVWNEAGTFLDFSVAPAYYQTTWFRLSCVAAFLALLWGLYQLRLRRVAQQFNMTLEARVGERTRIARELHDTLLQSFQGLLLRFQAVSNLLPGRPSEAKQRLEDAVDLAAQAITEGRDAVQGLRTSTVERNDLADAMKTLGEGLAADPTNQNPVDFCVAVEGTSRNLHPIVRDEVFRIASEGLHNAFRHANAKRVEVEIGYDQRRLRVCVRDDGKGIDPKSLSADGREGHYGLRGMRERAKVIGGQLTVWSELDSGTEVELSIPAAHAYTTSTERLRSWFAKKGSRRQSVDE